mgnify:CR=1 FL=1
MDSTLNKQAVDTETGGSQNVRRQAIPDGENLLSGRISSARKGMFINESGIVAFQAPVEFTERS